MITMQTHALTGGTNTIAETTPGSGRTHGISRISGYTLPLMTLYVGFRGSDKQPVIFKNVVVSSLRVRAQSGRKVTGTVELVGSGDLPFATNYDAPPCLDIIPIRFGDCQSVIAGVDYIATEKQREIEVFIQNDVTPQFDGPNIDMTRAERADRRPTGFNEFILGEVGDQLDVWAKARTTLPSYVRFGLSTRNVKYNVPQGLLKRAPNVIRFGGDPSESEMALIIKPKKVSGDATTPMTATAVSAQQTAFLTAA